MYVTVTHDGTGRLVAHGPHETPATTPATAPATAPDAAGPDGGSVTVAVCPPGAVDRTTGTLSHPYQYAAAGPVLAGVPVRPPTTASVTASVTDLNAATVAVCIHPVSHRMLVVGPFTGPDRAELWWHARINRFAETGARCHIVPLTAPLPGDGEPTSGGRA